eukprot:scaffold317971_cov23-Tisochrysis_lutea.AAC.1
MLLRLVPSGAPALKLAAAADGAVCTLASRVVGASASVLCVLAWHVGGGGVVVGVGSIGACRDVCVCTSWRARWWWVVGTREAWAWTWPAAMSKACDCASE